MRACVALLTGLAVSTLFTQPLTGEQGGAGSSPGAAIAKPSSVDSSARISGRVLDAKSGQPLANVSIRLASISGYTASDQVELLDRAGSPQAGGVLGSPASRTAVSNLDGTFELRNLPAGRYILAAAKNGFVTMVYGSRVLGEPARPIIVASGQPVDGIDIALPAAAVITGTVLSESGQPVVSAPVWLLRQASVDGNRRLVALAGQDPISGALDLTDVTDDLGQFRLFGLFPGTYYLAVGSPVRSNRAHQGIDPTAPFFLYPGTLDPAQAQPIVLSEGNEISVLVTTRRAATAVITGVLLPNGPLASATVTLVSHGAGGDKARDSVGVRADGTFRVDNLPRGRYTVFGRAEGQVGRVTVDLADADLFVPIPLGSGATFSGRVVFEGSTALASGQSMLDPKSVVLQLEATEVGVPYDQVTVAAPDWTFRVTGLISPTRLTVQARGWFLKSVQQNSRDLTDSTIDATRETTGVVVLLTQQVTALAGRVQNDRNQTVTAATVVAFAEQASRWGSRSRYVRVVRTDQEGRFEITGLPPARYLAVALDYLPEGEETNPDFLQQLVTLARPFQLDAGERETLDLRRRALP
jgi:protocatechuate 3,4-dioxygenase beta subunit